MDWLTNLVISVIAGLIIYCITDKKGKFRVEIRPHISKYWSPAPESRSDIQIEEVIVEITNTGRETLKIEGLGFLNCETNTYTDDEKLGHLIQLPQSVEVQKYLRFKLPESYYRKLSTSSMVLTVRDSSNNFWKPSRKENREIVTDMQEALGN